MNSELVWIRGSVEDLLKRIKREPGEIYELYAGVSIRQAAQLMKQKEISSVIARMNDGRYGIVTQADITFAVADSLDLDETTLEEIMTTKNLRTVTPKALILDAIHEMREGKFVRHLLVLDDGKLIGVLSVKDFINDIAKFEELWIHQHQ